MPTPSLHIIHIDKVCMTASPSTGWPQSGTVFRPSEAVLLLKLQKPVGTEAAVQTLPKCLLQKKAHSGIMAINRHFGSH